MKEPTPEDARRCLEIRKRSRRGEYSPPEDHDFCGEIFKHYKEWYFKTEPKVFNDTVPFGSKVRK